MENQNVLVDYLNYDKFFTRITEILTAEVDKWYQDFRKEIIYSEVESYADFLARTNIEDMSTYIESGNYDIPGNLAQIDINYNHDHEGIRFEEAVAKFKEGTDQKFNEEFQDWCRNWFFFAFGTNGFIFNFSSYIDDCMIDIDLDY